MEYVLIIVLFYVFGSISPAVITGKIVKGIDIRDVNSRNAGASNVTITLGLKYGVLVGVLDILKGFIPIILLRFIFPDNELLWFIGGLSAVIGHVFPFYLNFKGGKGTSTFVGVLLGGAPLLGLSLGILLVVLTLLSDYIAFGTLSLIFLAPVSLYVMDYQLLIVLIVIVYSSLSFYKHFSNLVKIYKKEELGLREAFRK